MLNPQYLNMAALNIFQQNPQKNMLIKLEEEQIEISLIQSKNELIFILNLINSLKKKSDFLKINLIEHFRE